MSWHRFGWISGGGLARREITFVDRLGSTHPPFPRIADFAHGPVNIWLTWTPNRWAFWESPCQKEDKNLYVCHFFCWGGMLVLTALMWPKNRCLLGICLLKRESVLFFAVVGLVFSRFFFLPLPNPFYLSHVFVGYLPLRGFPNHFCFFFFAFLPRKRTSCRAAFANLRLCKSSSRQCQSSRIRRVAISYRSQNNELLPPSSYVAIFLFGI